MAYLTCVNTLLSIYAVALAPASSPTKAAEVNDEIAQVKKGAEENPLKIIELALIAIGCNSKEITSHLNSLAQQVLGRAGYSKEQAASFRFTTDRSVRHRLQQMREQNEEYGDA